VPPAKLPLKGQGCCRQLVIAGLVIATCHVGRNGGKSKTEAMFFLPPDAKYEGADLSPIAVGDGHITFTKSFKLLGSMLAYDLEDNDAIECRIKRAQGAFSAMQKQF
jgi:hypothetical protein